MIWLIAIAGGIASVLFNNDKQLLRKQEENFKYTYDYLRSSLPHFYFNNSDCSTISKALETDKYLRAEMDCLLKYNDAEDAITQLVNQGKITL